MEFTHDGLITVQCRDLARLLLEQIAFPPVIPRATDYPLLWDPIHDVNNPDITQTTSSWVWPTYETDSNKKVSISTKRCGTLTFSRPPSTPLATASSTPRRLPKPFRRSSAGKSKSS